LKFFFLFTHSLGGIKTLILKVFGDNVANLKASDCKLVIICEASLVPYL